MSGKFPDPPTVLEQTTVHPKAKVKATGAKKVVVSETKHKNVNLAPLKSEVKPEVKPEPKKTKVKKSEEKSEEKSKDKPAPAEKKKRVLSEKQLQSLALGREARAKKLAEKMAAKKPE